MDLVSILADLETAIEGQDWSLIEQLIEKIEVEVYSSDFDEYDNGEDY